MQNIERSRSFGEKEKRMHMTQKNLWQWQKRQELGILPLD